MQFLKFFLAIVFIQIITITLIYISPTRLNDIDYLRLTIPLLFIAMLMAFWLNSLAGHGKKDVVDKMKDSFAKEREEIRVKAEKNIAKEAKVTHAKANFKVGAAFAGVVGVGALFILAQMMTAALLTLSAAGGAAGGFYWRGKHLSKRKEKNEQLEVIDVKAIETK